MKRYAIFAAVCSLVVILAFPLFSHAFSVDAKSALLMEASTGTVLFEQNADEALPPASVTKVMTMLLVMEAIDDGRITLNDTVSVSQHASEMGGSQIYLEPGETMTVEDLLKSVVVSSANDAAVALAEYVAGSEESFVEAMNARAEQLGMEHTHFENTNGLDDDTVSHLTSARDIALMSRELIVHHPAILTYSSIWMDSIRDGAFTLTNTNRLIRFYPGANGLKTGSTSRAKFCISATAQRDGMQLIAVIMGAETRDIRNENAKKMLDYGFSNYCFVHYDADCPDPIPLQGGTEPFCSVSYPAFEGVFPKGADKKITQTVTLPDVLIAPIRVGDCIGRVTYLLDGETVGEVDITASCDIERVGFGQIFGEMIQKIFSN